MNGFLRTIAPILGETLKESLEVTLLVLLMMSLVEAFDTFSGGRIFRGLRRSGRGQILVSGLLGSIPGCAGGFAAVSLYTHRMISFGALLAMMVATAGDEAFLMLAMFPRKALGLLGILLGLGIVLGWAADRMGIGRNLPTERCREPFCAEGEGGDEKPESIKEFFREHIWHHIIRKHLPGIFGWTFGIMLAFSLLGHYFDLETWVGNNPVVMVLLATAVGFIPESGPHIAFVTLFANGVIPFPVLLANSISQDGHASLPLLAESRKAFFLAKAVKAVPAILIPLALLLF